MNTMKEFYVSLCSASGLQAPYLEALAEITKINHKQANALVSDLGWQNWSDQNQEIATRQA